MKKDFHVLLVLSAMTRQHAELLRDARKALANQAQLSVLYVVSNISSLTQQIDIQERLGQSVLEEVARTLNLPPDRLFMAKGSIKKTINDFTKKLRIDQIVADLSCMEIGRKNHKSFYFSQPYQYLQWLKPLNVTKILVSIINNLSTAVVAMKFWLRSLLAKSDIN